MSDDIIDLTMTDPDPADEQTHSAADLATICDVTMWHQMPHLPARRLIQLNCERWPVWNPCYRDRIVKARILDDSRDWYFPIIVKEWIPKPEEIVPPELYWTWSGIWHESGDHAHTERALTLPPMLYLGQDWRYANFVLSQIAASAGGLLLIWSEKEMIPKRASSRLKKIATPQYREIATPHWARLLVCNPLTKVYRELPPPNWEQVACPLWRTAYYERAEVRMVVDDEANSYQVILLLQNFVAVYKSTTNSWNCLRFQPGRQRFSQWSSYSAAARVGARIYAAEVRTHDRNLANGRLPALRMDPVSNPTPAGVLRVFDIYAETGTWKLLDEYTLRKFHLPVLNQFPEIFPFDMGVVNHVELVECMGDLYAIVPARLHDVVIVGQKQTPVWKNELLDFDTRGLKRKNRLSFELLDRKEVLKRELGVKYMPLVFYVMQLRAGDGVDHAVLRIEVPKHPSNQAHRKYLAARMRMFDKTDVNRARGVKWFICEARGSVIWVSYEDYLLSYDVVSRKSTLQMIPADVKSSTDDSTNQIRLRRSTLQMIPDDVESSTDDSTNQIPLLLAYRPSFHMKP